jgi:uncharacterized protein (DUF2461 family)
MLAAIRAHIAEHHQELRKIIRAKALRDLFGEMHGEKLSRVPKGFAADHPAADLLVFKRFIFYKTLPPELAATPELYGEIVKRFKALKPFLDFLISADVAPAPRRMLERMN